MEEKIIIPPPIEGAARQSENESPEPEKKSPPANPLIIKVIAVVLIVGLLGGFGYWAYSHGYISIPYLTPSSDELVEKFINSFSNIDNAKYELTFRAKTEEHDSKYTSIYKTKEEEEKAEDALDTLDSLAPMGIGYNDIDDLFGVFPGELDLTVGTTIYFETDVDPKDADFLWQIGGSYSGGDLTVEADLEIRKVAENFYGIIRKFPSLFFFDVSSIKEKWVIMTPEDGFGESIKSGYSSFKYEEAVQKMTDALQAAFDAELFKLSGKKASEVITGVKSEHYTVEINPDAIAGAFGKLIDKMKERGDDVKNIESSLEQFNKYYEDETNAEIVKKIVANTNIEVWLDKTNGFIRQAKIEFILVPPEKIESLKGKQLNLSLVTTLDKINEKVKVDVPSTTIDYNEAERLITGKSLEEQNFDRQRTRVNDIRTALDNYNDDRNKFPETLSALEDEVPILKEECEQKKKEAEERRDKALNESGNIDYDSNFVSCYDYNSTVSIIDIYTEDKYDYMAKDDDYELKYEMEIPEDASSYYADEYAEGTNTATKTDVSLEGEGYSYKPLNFNTNTNTNTNSNTNTTVANPSTENIMVVNGDDHVIGVSDSAVTIVEYADLQCPYCATFHDTMKQVVEEYSDDVRWVFRHFPVDTIHPLALKAAEASECANDQDKFWEYVDMVYENQPDLTETYLTTIAQNIELDIDTFDECLSSEKYKTVVEDAFLAGGELGISGTPSFYINGVFHGGTIEFAQMKKIIDSLLDEAVVANEDTDGDRINDIDEQYYGTDKTKADTDSDGYDDYTEITSGYNPLGPGEIVRDGTWSGCINLAEFNNCIEYCQSINKTCNNLGITSRDYENWAVEVFSSADECNSLNGTGGNQYKCAQKAEIVGDETARWKCNCK
ncbi:MAG: DsbA family protein [bacterium]|nr:DsbA family protein [bacterium]